MKMQPSSVYRVQKSSLHWPVVIIAAVIAILLVSAVLVTFQGNWVAFALPGTRFSTGDPAGTTGYDGQFFYHIARYGWDAEPYIDSPSLRYMRIGYPLLGAALSLGQPDWVPYALVLINIMAVMLGSGLLAQRISLRGASPYWALLYTLWPGVVLALRLDLAEPLCVALALAGLTAHEDQRHMQAVLWLVLSALTKEIGLIMAGGLALHALFQRRYRLGLALGAIPAGVWIAWLFYVRSSVGKLPFGNPVAHLEWPLAGWLSIPEPANLVLTGLWMVLPTLILMMLALVTIFRHRALDTDSVLVLVAASFVLTMPDLSWEDAIAAYRVGVFLVVTGLLLLSHWRRTRLYMVLLWGSSILLVPLAPGLFFNILS